MARKTLHHEPDGLIVRGIGIGLRSVHYDHILSRRPAVPWFEAISENYMGLRGGQGGRPLEILQLVRERYPVILHGVSMNIGSADPLDQDYLKKLKRLADLVKPAHISDHLCWTGTRGRNLHDLLPLPYTREALNLIVPRVRKIQETLGRRFLLENVSSYAAYRHSEMPEWEFLAEIAERSGCGILLDVNNVYVSAMNHRYDPLEYIDAVPAGMVIQMHLAGYSESGALLIDTHDHPVSDPVWDLYARALRRFGDVPTLIEWDDRIPSFRVLEEQAARAEKIRREVLSERPAPALSS
ncbi:MAG: MNIO family bufferin maturase [Elusimicrobiota bacterium]